MTKSEKVSFNLKDRIALLDEIRSSYISSRLTDLAYSKRVTEIFGIRISEATVRNCRVALGIEGNRTANAKVVKEFVRERYESAKLSDTKFAGLILAETGIDACSSSVSNFRTELGIAPYNAQMSHRREKPVVQEENKDKTTQVLLQKVSRIETLLLAIMKELNIPE
jgi:hypothetical protein